MAIYLGARRLTGCVGAINAGPISSALRDVPAEWGIGRTVARGRSEVVTCNASSALAAPEPLSDGLRLRPPKSDEEGKAALLARQSHEPRKAASLSTFTRRQ